MTVRSQRGSAGSRQRRRGRGGRRRWFWGMGAGLVLASVLFGACYRWGIVVGSSMLPNFVPGEWFLVDRRAYRKALPQRGDVVLAQVEGVAILKRVVALPGERVEVIRGEVWIDGQRRESAPRWLPGELTLEPGVLAPGRYALLGDNRSQTDRRTLHAVVEVEQIAGRVCWAAERP